jgi:hypothetical protein
MYMDKFPDFESYDKHLRNALLQYELDERNLSMEAYKSLPHSQKLSIQISANSALGYLWTEEDYEPYKKYLTLTNKETNA